MKRCKRKKANWGGAASAIFNAGLNLMVNRAKQDEENEIVNMQNAITKSQAIAAETSNLAKNMNEFLQNSQNIYKDLNKTVQKYGGKKIIKKIKRKKAEWGTDDTTDFTGSVIANGINALSGYMNTLQDAINSKNTLKSNTALISAKNKPHNFGMRFITADELGTPTSDTRTYMFREKFGGKCVKGRKNFYLS